MKEQMNIIKGISGSVRDKACEIVEQHRGQWAPSDILWIESVIHNQDEETFEYTPESIRNRAIEAIKEAMNYNEYFEEVGEIIQDWQKRKDEHNAKKQDIINAFGWDSEEVKAWYAENDKIKVSPFERGEAKAYKAWVHSIVRGKQKEIEMDDFLFDDEVHSFCEAMKHAGIRSFIYTNTSTAMMGNMHSFEKEGWKLEGLCTIEKIENYRGKDEIIKVRGVRFILK